MHSSRVFKTRNERGERGSVLAISAVGMLSLLMAVGLGVDISRFYLAKNELQNAADAAALAGASALNSSADGITEAANRAVQAMNNYDFNKKAVSFPRSNVLFAVNLDGPYMSETAAAAQPSNIRFVQVSAAPSPVGVTFVQTVLGNQRNLASTATAGMSIPLNVLCDWIPLSVLDDPANPLTPGNMYTIRSAPGNHISPGNYQILAPEGPGGNDTRTGLAGGVHLCVSPGDSVPTKPGVTAGPVRQGLNTRFDMYQGPVDPTAYPPDTNVAEGITYAQYRDGTVGQAPSNPGLPGRRVVLIPIIKDPPGNGRSSIIIDRFGAFFLRTSVGNGNGGDIQAEYIADRILVGHGGYDPNGGAANQLLAVPVLYK